MDEKTPRVINQKIAGKESLNHGDTHGVTGKASPTPFLGDVDEKKESEVGVNVRYRPRSGRGTGWFSASTTDYTKTTIVSDKDRKKSQRQLPSSSAKNGTVKQQSYRQASPMARIRDDSIREASTAVDRNIRFKFVTDQKSDSEVKKEKQRKWKQKMKIAQERKRQERKVLDDVSTVTSDAFNGKAIISCVLDNVEHTQFFKQFTRCGEPADEDSVFEQWVDESSASSGEEEDSRAVSSTVAGPGGRRSRGRTRRRPSVSSLESSVETSVESSVDSSALDDEKSDTKAIAQKKTDSKSKKASPPTLKDPEPVRMTSPTGTDAAHMTIDGSTANSESRASEVHASSTKAAIMLTPNRHSSSTMTTTPPSPTKERNLIKNFLDDIKTMGESMLWHKETNVMHPANINVRLKKGYRCPNGTFCGPRLVWTDESNNHTYYGLDLFDIQSLKRADTLELENFPYAMPGRTVRLNQTNGNSFIFEAVTEDDAWRFVRGMKWVVSRLAFNLVIGNLDVSCELLEMDLMDDKTPKSTLIEFDWSRAMDDIADHMAERALAAIVI